MPNSIAAQWNRKMDAVIDAVDTCTKDDRVVRRSCLDAKLREAGLIIQTREAVVALLDRFHFFEHGPMKGWLDKVFPDHARDPEECILRTAEEVMELAQCEGVTRAQLHALVDQVMDKSVGEPLQELGGVMVTLGSYCAVRGYDAGDAFNTEFERCNRPETIVKIQRKHVNKLVVSSKIR